MLRLTQQATAPQCRQNSALPSRVLSCRPALAQPRSVSVAAKSSSASAWLPTGVYNSRRACVIAYAAEAPEAEAAPAAAGDDGAQGEKTAKKRRYVPYWKRRKQQGSSSNGESGNAETTMLPRGWFADPSYTAATLYEELLKRCEDNETALGPLFQMCKLTTTPDEARITLNAFAAVRTARVRNGKPETFPEKLSSAFVQAIRESDSADVLVEALQRATELGLTCSTSSINRLLKVWGARNELPKVEQVIAAMPLGGALYTAETAYIIIRTALSAGQKEKADYYAQAMRERQVRLTPAAERLLEKNQ